MHFLHNISLVCDSSTSLWTISEEACCGVESMMSVLSRILWKDWFLMYMYYLKFKIILNSLLKFSHSYSVGMSLSILFTHLSVLTIKFSGITAYRAPGTCCFQLFTFIFPGLWTPSKLFVGIAVVLESSSTVPLTFWKYVLQELLA